MVSQPPAPDAVPLPVMPETLCLYRTKVGVVRFVGYRTKRLKRRRCEVAHIGPKKSGAECPPQRDPGARDNGAKNGSDGTAPRHDAAVGGNRLA